jgi:hypothetical protein
LRLGCIFDDDQKRFWLLHINEAAIKAALAVM